jgi:choline dehydrogenase
MNPKSRGEVTLSSSNPLDLPDINPNFLSNKEDIDIFISSLRLAREVINTKPLSDIILEEILPGKNIDDDESLTNYCKTCKMGKESDDTAVLNSKLQVKGIDNLRVFDVSMMPNIVAANTNAPAMAIADKATDIMLEN